jgi:hypothetical protein
VTARSVYTQFLAVVFSDGRATYVAVRFTLPALVAFALDVRPFTASFACFFFYFARATTTPCAATHGRATDALVTMLAGPRVRDVPAMIVHFSITTLLVF